MAGRWLPEVISYGAYFPSKSRQVEAAKKYQTEDFFNHVESQEYLEKARAFYLEKAEVAFGAGECNSPEHVVTLLHERLTSQFIQLQQIEPAWRRLNDIRHEQRAISENLDQYLQDENTRLLNIGNEISLLTRGKKQWQQYRAYESLVYAVLSWLPAVRTKRHYHINLFLDSTFGTRMTSFQGNYPEDIDEFIDSLIAKTQKEQDECQQNINYAKDIARREIEAAKQWRELTYALGYRGDDELNLQERMNLPILRFVFQRSW